MTSPTETSGGYTSSHPDGARRIGSDGAGINRPFDLSAPPYQPRQSSHMSQD